LITSGHINPKTYFIDLQLLMKNAPIGLSIACRSRIFLTNEYKLKIDGMKSLQLTDSEFLLLHDLLASMLASPNCVVAAGGFCTDKVRGINVRVFDHRLIRDIYNKFRVKNA